MLSWLEPVAQYDFPSQPLPELSSGRKRKTLYDIAPPNAQELAVHGMEGSLNKRQRVVFQENDGVDYEPVTWDEEQVMAADLTTPRASRIVKPG